MKPYNLDKGIELLKEKHQFGSSSESVAIMHLIGMLDDVQSLEEEVEILRNLSNYDGLPTSTTT